MSFVVLVNDMSPFALLIITVTRGGGSLVIYLSFIQMLREKERNMLKL